MQVNEGNSVFLSTYLSSKQVNGESECLSFFVGMPQLSDADRAVVSACFLEKGWRGTKICEEFRSKKWEVRTIYRLIKKIEKNNSTERKKGSG